MYCLPLLRFPEFCHEERFVGAGKVEIEKEVGLGNRMDVWKPRELRVTVLCGRRVVVKEEPLEAQCSPFGKCVHLFHNDGSPLVSF